MPFRRPPEKNPREFYGLTLRPAPPAVQGLQVSDGRGRCGLWGLGVRFDFLWAFEYSASFGIGEHGFSLTPPPQGSADAYIPPLRGVSFAG